MNQTVNTMTQTDLDGPEEMEQQIESDHDKVKRQEKEFRKLLKSLTVNDVEREKVDQAQDVFQTTENTNYFWFDCLPSWMIQKENKGKGQGFRKFGAEY